MGMSVLEQLASMADANMTSSQQKKQNDVYHPETDTISYTNDVLIAVALLERVVPMLKESTRETIRKSQLTTIKSLVDNCIYKVSPYCKEPLIMVPLMEIDKLIEIIQTDDTFVETDIETKEMLSDKLSTALSALYLFAGKFYVTHEFKYDMGTGELVKRIVDSCISQGFYFGYDTLLEAEGVL